MWQSQNDDKNQSEDILSHICGIKSQNYDTLSHFMRWKV